MKWIKMEDINHTTFDRVTKRNCTRHHKALQFLYPFHCYLGINIPFGTTGIKCGWNKWVVYTNIFEGVKRTGILIEELRKRRCTFAFDVVAIHWEKTDNLLIITKIFKRKINVFLKFFAKIVSTFFFLLRVLNKPKCSKMKTRLQQNKWNSYLNFKIFISFFIVWMGMVWRRQR